MKVSLKIDKQRPTDLGNSIIIYINFNGKRKNIATGFHTLDKDWNAQTFEPLSTHPQYHELMNYLLDLKKKINNIGNVNKYNSISEIIALLLQDESRRDDFIHFWEKLGKEYSNKKLPKAKNYNSVLEIVKQYQHSITFGEINYSFLTSFRDYKLKNGCTANGIHSYLRTFRAVYNEALKREAFIPPNSKNPFLGVFPKLEKTKDKYFTIEEMQSILKNIEPNGKVIIPGYNNTPEAANKEYHYHNYFLLCFYLGGIDFIDLVNLKKKHVRNDRIKFTRFKGGTNEIINNFIFPEAKKILDHYKNDSEYLLPLYNYSYTTLRDNYQRRFGKWLTSIGITSYFSSKTPRYSFIHIGSRELYQNRDIIKELVGHSQNDTTSIYEGKFPDKIKDEVHRKIIDSVVNPPDENTENGK